MSCADKRLGWRLLPAAIIIICVLCVAGPWMIAGAADSVWHDRVATAGDADGMYMSSDGYYHYYRSETEVSDSGWLSVNSDLSVRLDSAHRVVSCLTRYGNTYRRTDYNRTGKSWSYSRNVWDTFGDDDYYFDSNGLAAYIYYGQKEQIYAYKDGLFVKLTNCLQQLKDGKLYYFDDCGDRETSKGAYMADANTTYNVGSGGYVTGKLLEGTKSVKYYEYNYTSHKWIIKKNAWCNVANIDYYLGSSGKATKEYDTDTGELLKCKNGKYSNVRRKLVRMKSGRLYYFGTDSIRIKKNGWYKISSKWQAGVGSGGYVTVKYNTRTGDAYVYNYKTKKWECPKSTKIVKKILKKNPCYTAGRKITVKGLMLHSTGDGQSKASAYLKTWNSSSYSRACVHGFIDANNGKTYQTLPWNHRGWHCGWSGNNTHIGVEMCEPDGITYTGGTSFVVEDIEAARIQATRTYNSAVTLFAKLCKKYNLNPLADGVIVSHHEGYVRGIASNHGDPEHLWKGLGLPYTMDSFRKAVAAKLKTIK